VNLYGMVGNDLVNHSDNLGLAIISDRPTIQDLTKSGAPPGGNRGIILALYAFHTFTQFEDCPEGCAQVRWDTVKSITKVTGLMGKGRGAIAHEQLHKRDAYAVWNEVVKSIDSYVGKCMSEERAECFNSITPSYMPYATAKYRLLAAIFYRDGNPALGLSAYSQFEQERYDIPGEIEESSGLLQFYLNQIGDKFKRCKEME